jgi:hypothetical protein
MAISGFLVLQTRSFIRSSKVARGQVIDLEPHHRAGGRRLGGGGYVTVFTFTDAVGQSHTARTDGAQNPPTHQIGDSVEVLYQAGRPESARIRSFQTLWLLPILLGGPGIFFAAIGGGGLVAGNKS